MYLQNRPLAYCERRQVLPFKAFLSTIVLRHRKENLKKCSLRGLEDRDDFLFFSYPKDQLPSLDGYVALSIEGSPLTKKDEGKGLFLLDATWRYAGKMQHDLGSPKGLEYRSIPRDFVTAYPRRQVDCIDPSRGLASVEAIYIAYHILGRDCTGLLDGYYWNEAFLTKNEALW